MEEGEEERATTVPNREGKVKSRWTDVSLPRFMKRRPGLHIRSEILLLLAIVSLICGTGPHVNETWSVISHAKCDLAALARGAALVIDLYFF